MRLIVKGTKDEAVKAAAARGIPVEVVGMTTDGCTLATCDDAHVTAALLWFVEPVAVEPGSGFPPGSLLHYSHGRGA